MGEYVLYTVMLTGSGAFSTVYKAQNRETGQLVAIKVVRKHELNASQVCNLPPSSVSFVHHEILQRIRALFASGGSPSVKKTLNMFMCCIVCVTNRYLFLNGWLYVL
jgi:serine/threonine protein kinase